MATSSLNIFRFGKPGVEGIEYLEVRRRGGQ
jgi:hypothetical protein